MEYIIEPGEYYSVGQREAQQLSLKNMRESFSKMISEYIPLSKEQEEDLHMDEAFRGAINYN